MVCVEEPVEPVPPVPRYFLSPVPGVTAYVPPVIGTTLPVCNVHLVTVARYLFCSCTSMYCVYLLC